MTGLALWVCGAILAGSACQNAVASALSARGNWNSLRQYLREWLYDGSDRARPCQTELDVSLCFAPLLRWVLTWWRSGRLALAVDPTLKGDQTTAIVISVVYRGCAIPVAWLFNVNYFCRYASIILAGSPPYPGPAAGPFRSGSWGH